MQMKPRLACQTLLVTLLIGIAVSARRELTADDGTPPSSETESWTIVSPRSELQPQFAYIPNGGWGNQSRFVIQHDQREGLDGAWQKTFPITAGQTYRFTVYRLVEGITDARQAANVRLVWRDANQQLVTESRGVVTDYLKNFKAQAYAEFPQDRPLPNTDWVEVAGVYQAPEKAVSATVELHFQWAPNAKVTYSAPA